MSRFMEMTKEFFGLQLVEGNHNGVIPNSPVDFSILVINFV